MNPQTVKDRALEIYRDATPEQVIAGKSWYSNANAACWTLALASYYRYTPEQCARIIASLSPRVKWDKNLELAYMVVTGTDPDDLPCLGNSRKATKRVMATQTPGSGMRGQKCERFYQAINGDEEAVTVDVWTFQALGGEKDAPTAKEYKACVSGIVRAAIQIGTISPRDLQAVIWVVARGKDD
jgi:hypothetical protein